jgi:hypothetical protein
MKNVAIIILLCLCAYVRAQTPVQIVQTYGDNLHSWAETSNDGLYRKNVERLCNKGTLFKDKLTHQLAKEKYGELDSYQLATFLNCIQRLFEERITFKIENVKLVNKSDVSIVNSNSRSCKLFESELQFASCNVKISGSLTYYGTVLIYIRNGKITKVDDYIVSVNSVGEKKVKVDLSDILDLTDMYYGEYDAIGGYVGYSKYFPISLGICYNFSVFNIGLEFGANFSDTPLTVKENLNEKETISQGGAYILASPGVFLRYATFNMGMGVAIKNKSSYNYNSHDTDGSPNLYFMMKPSVEFNIPFTVGLSDVFICPKVSYIHIPKLRQNNCWEIGLGFRYIIADL